MTRVPGTAYVIAKRAEQRWGRLLLPRRETPVGLENGFEIT